MKKIIAILSLCSISLVALGQSKNVQNAYNAFRQENFKEAKEFIDIAFNHELTANDPKMWNYSKFY